MIQDILLSPPVAMCIFLAVAYAIYHLGGVLSPPGENLPGKCLPYACGEDLTPPEPPRDKPLAETPSAAREAGSGRPTKKERRQTDRLKPHG